MQLNPRDDRVSDERLRHALVALARVHVTATQSLTAAFHSLADVVMSAMDIQRFSVWLCTDDQHAVRQLYLHSGITTATSEGTILRTEDFPSYFRALRDNRTLAIETLDDDVVRELAAPYLQPLGIGALLDAPFFRGGTAVGIVCNEHVGAGRTWTVAERAFAGAVADACARLFEEVARHTAEHSVEVYRQKLTELRRLEAVGRLAAGIAHDVNNLLMVIGGNASLLDESVTSPQDRELLQSIADAVASGQRMTSQLLQFGRGATGGPTVCALDTIVADVVRMAGAALGGTFRVETTVRAPMSRVFVDSAEFGRVVLNLLLNARDAMDGVGTVEVDVGGQDVMTADGARRRCVVVTVRDRGVGMTEEIRRRMFDAFFTTKGNGTGLGLAIAHQIVHRAGGFIQVESTEGVGTAISVMLPTIE